jgi:hypothetical protein
MVLLGPNQRVAFIGALDNLPVVEQFLILGGSCPGRPHTGARTILLGDVE